MGKIKVMNLIVHMGAGGAQELLINYLRQLKDDDKFDYWVYVVEGARNSKYDQIILKEQLQVKYLDAPSVSKAKTKLGFALCKFIDGFYIGYAIKKFGPDIIHTHITKIFECAFLPLLFSKTKVIFHTLHSDPDTYRGFDLFLAKTAFRNKRITPICINKNQMEKAKEHYGFQYAHVLYNVIDIKEIREKRISKTNARKKWGLTDNMFVIGAVGRLNVVKNYSFLIDVFYEVCRKREDAVLLIAGSGDSSKLKRKVEQFGLDKKVFFLGEIEEPVKMYCALDVYINTSVHESCSLTTLEAQAVGIKCVVSTAVPKETIFSNAVKRVELSRGAGEWAEYICNLTEYDKAEVDEREYTVENGLLRLKGLYLEKLSRSESE